MSMSQQRQAVRDLSEQEVINYFFPRPVPMWTNITIIFGMLLIIFGGILLNPFVMVVGLLVDIASAYMIYKRMKSNPDDAHYEAWVEQQARELYSRALQTLGMHFNKNDGLHRIRSYILPGSLASDDYIPDDVLMKRGKDGRWHFSINVYTYVFSTAHSLAIFKSDINAFNPLLHLDLHEVYAYRHIIGATTSQLRDRVILGEERFPCRTEQFCLKIANGETVRLSATVKAGPLGSVPGVPIITITNASYDRTLSELRQIFVARR